MRSNGSSRARRAGSNAPAAGPGRATRPRRASSVTKSGTFATAGGDRARSGARNRTPGSALSMERLVGERRARGANHMRNTFKAIAAAAAFLAAAPLLSADPKGDEPIAVPTNIKQGIDFVYVDP